MNQATSPNSVKSFKSILKHMWEGAQDKAAADAGMPTVDVDGAVKGDLRQCQCYAATLFGRNIRARQCDQTDVQQTCTHTSEEIVDSSLYAVCGIIFRLRVRRKKALTTKFALCRYQGLMA